MLKLSTFTYKHNRETQQRLLHFPNWQWDSTSSRRDVVRSLTSFQTWTKEKAAQGIPVHPRGKSAVPRRLKEEEQVRTRTRTRIQTAANSIARMFLTEEDLTTEEIEAKDLVEQTIPALHQGPSPDDIGHWELLKPNSPQMYSHYLTPGPMLILFSPTPNDK